MKIAIYSRLLEEDKRSDVQFFFDELARQKIAAAVFLPFYEEIKDRINLPPDTSTFYLSDDLTNDIEFVISLGGDGTLLDTVGLVRDKGIPIMGINFGRLGFLASIGREQLADAVKALKKQTYVIDKRTMIHLDASISMFGNVPFALNEFSIHKRDTAPMIKIHTYLNGEFLNTYWADGSAAKVAVVVGGRLLRVALLMSAPVSELLAITVPVSVLLATSASVIVRFAMSAPVSELSAPRSSSPSRRPGPGGRAAEARGCRRGRRWW